MIIAPASNNVQKPAILFKERPDIFVAQLDGNCKVEWDHDVLYPDPGPDEDVTTDIRGKSVKMSYKDCKPVNNIGNHPRGKKSAVVNGVAAGAHDDSVSSSSVPVVNMSTTSSVKAASLTSPTTSSSSVESTAAAEPSSLGGLVESLDATCGKGTRYRCPQAQCCSQYGWVSEFLLLPSPRYTEYPKCGYDQDYCGIGKCQPEYGRCDNLPVKPKTTTVITKTHTLEYYTTVWVDADYISAS